MCMYVSMYVCFFNNNNNLFVEPKDIVNTKVTKLGLML